MTAPEKTFYEFIKTSFKGGVMLRKIILNVIVCGMVVGLFSFHSWAEVGLWAGSEAGTYIKIANDIKAINNADMKIQVYPGGSLINIKKVLYDKDAQFAIVQNDALIYYNHYIYDRLRDKINMILPLYNEEIHLIVRKGANIDHASDLNGKKVNMDKKESGCWVTATVIKDQLNLDWIEFNYPPAEAMEKLLHNEIDAFIYVCGKPAPVLQKLKEDASTHIKLIPLKLEQGYIPSLIEGGTYLWQKNDIETMATKSILITYHYNEAHNSPQRYKIYVKNIRTMIGNIIDRLDYLRANKHPKWQEIDPYDYKKVDWPMHYAAEEMIIPHQATVRPSVQDKNN